MVGAKLLIEAPDAVQKMHEIYLEAGADCITSATYPASLPGFLSRGLDEKEARHLMGEATRLAVAARDEFWQKHDPPTDRIRTVAAASVGPYGAVLACDSIPNVAAVGINCTSPLHISSLLAIAKEHTTKPIIVYPNLGNRFDPVSKT